MSSIGIIMSTYNGEKYIREQIDSILSSNLQDFQLFVIDDGSSDKTEEIVRSYSENSIDRVFFIKNPENLGSTESFLHGLSVLSGSEKKVPEGWDRAVSEAQKCRYYMFSDQDDIWLRDKLSLTYSQMVRMEQKFGQSKPLLVFTDSIVVGENGEFIAPSFHKREKLGARLHGFNRCLMENKAMGCTIMINKSLAKLVKLPDGPEKKNIRFHDWWLMLIASSTGKIKYLNASTMLYRQTGTNQVGGTGFNAQVKDRTCSSLQTKERLRLTFLQAETFFSLYGDRLNRRRSKILKDFISIPEMNPVMKRKTIITHRFYKSGFIRNVGVMMFV